MTTGSIVRRLVAALLATLLASCGGGEGGAAVHRAAAATAAPLQQAAAATTAAAQQLAARATAALVRRPPAGDTRRRALALGPSEPVGAEHVLDWAEWKFPELFPKGPASFALVFEGVPYTVRAYGNGNHLGITGAGAIFGLGPFTLGQLVPFGAIADYATLVRADRCAVYPGSCDSGPPPGALNECQPLTANSLVAGTRVQLEYDISGLASGRQTLESLVEGPAVFEGANAVLLTSTAIGTITVLGQTIEDHVVIRSYLQDAGGGLVRTLGNVTDVYLGGDRVGSTRQVFDPPYVDAQFTLAPGQSLTQTTTSIDTELLPPGPPVRSSETVTYTFTGRAPLSQGGRTYDSCRYLERTGPGASEVDTVWYHVGTGLVLRFESGGGEVVLQLRSGRINGTPL